MPKTTPRPTATTPTTNSSWSSGRTARPARQGTTTMAIRSARPTASTTPRAWPAAPHWQAGITPALCCSYHPGRLAAVHVWQVHTTHLRYQADSNLTAENYPNATSATSAYDIAGQVTQITDRSGSWPFL